MSTEVKDPTVLYIVQHNLFIPCNILQKTGVSLPTPLVLFNLGFIIRCRPFINLNSRITTSHVTPISIMPLVFIDDVTQDHQDDFKDEELT